MVTCECPISSLKSKSFHLEIRIFEIVHHLMGPAVSGFAMTKMCDLILGAVVMVLSMWMLFVVAIDECLIYCVQS